MDPFWLTIALVVLAVFVFSLQGKVSKLERTRHTDFQFSAPFIALKEALARLQETVKSLQKENAALRAKLQDKKEVSLEEFLAGRPAEEEVSAPEIEIKPADNIVSHSEYFKFEQIESRPKEHKEEPIREHKPKPKPEPVKPKLKPQEPIRESHPKVKLAYKPIPDAPAGPSLWSHIERAFVENWTGILGAVITVFGVGFLGIYTALNVEPWVRFLIINGFAVGLGILSYILLQKKYFYWRQLGAWVRSAAGAVVLFACVGAISLPDLKWINSDIAGYGLMSFGLALNMWLAFAGGGQPYASVHCLLSMVALSFTPPDLTGLGVATLVSLFGIWLTYREKWDWHLAITVTGYGAYHLHWFLRFPEIVQMTVPNLICDLMIALVGAAAIAVHYRRLYGGEGKFEVVPFAAHAITWLVIGISIRLHSTGSPYRIIGLALLSGLMYLAARQGKNLGVKWLYYTDSIVAQILATLALSALSSLDYTPFQIGVAMFLESCGFAYVALRQGRLFIYRLGTLFAIGTGGALVYIAWKVFLPSADPQIAQATIVFAATTLGALFYAETIRKFPSIFPEVKELDNWLWMTGGVVNMLGMALSAVMLVKGFLPGAPNGTILVSLSAAQIAIASGLYYIARKTDKIGFATIQGVLLYVLGLSFAFSLNVFSPLREWLAFFAFAQALLVASALTLWGNPALRAIGVAVVSIACLTFFGISVNSISGALPATIAAVLAFGWFVAGGASLLGEKHKLSSVFAAFVTHFLIATALSDYQRWDYAVYFGGALLLATAIGAFRFGDFLFCILTLANGVLWNILAWNGLFSGQIPQTIGGSVGASLPLVLTPVLIACAGLYFLTKNATTEAGFGRGLLGMAAQYSLAAFVFMFGIYAFADSSPRAPERFWILASIALLEIAALLQIVFKEAGVYFAPLKFSGYSGLICFFCAAIVAHKGKSPQFITFQDWLTDLLGLGAFLYLTLRHTSLSQGKGAKNWYYWEALLVYSSFIVLWDPSAEWKAFCWIGLSALCLAIGTIFQSIGRLRLYAVVFYWASALDIILISGSYLTPAVSHTGQLWLATAAATALQFAMVAANYRLLRIESIEASKFGLDLVRAFLGFAQRSIFYYPAFISMAFFLYFSFDAAILTILWTIEACAVFVISIVFGEKHFRYAALGGLALCVARLVFWDMRQSDTLSRAVVFVVVGLLLLLVNSLYMRFKGRFDKKEQSAPEPPI